jgi:sulfate permease, SulP family
MAKTLAPWPRKGSAVADPANLRRWDSISSRARSLAGDVAPRMITELSRDIASGLIVSVIGIAYCVSFSALIFSRELAPGIPAGLNALFLGAGISGIVVALASSLPRAVGGPDTSVMAVFSALAMSVVASSSIFWSDESAIMQVLVEISFGTFVTGIAMLGLGLLRLSVVVRFIPFSVVAGFLAASGCLLIAGAFRVSTQLEASPGNFISAATQPSPAGQKLWLAVLFALVLHAIRLRCRHLFGFRSGSVSR